MVLVDITPDAEPEGIARIQGFMTANRDGFATVDEAAEAVAGYLPHRPRAPNPRGLMKNLRERNGRLYWHWDPSFLAVTAADRNADGGRLERAARALNVPTLLVRGSDSDIVSPRAARNFLDLVPHAEMLEVAGAAHMVAGDQNTAFGTALTGFLQRNAPALSIDRRLSEA
jgi:pimeloyl-ACP methyl ester carboxylesterase